MEIIYPGELVAKLDVNIMEQKDIGGFVFVVCGSREHLDTLQFSYQVLVKKTRFPVYVVTDNSRNEFPLVYDYLVDIHTPENFDHHQASIWLKTSLHKILPAGKLYTYLDTDILALQHNVDDIFKAYIPPILFAPDHCKMPQFGMYAIHCGCLDMLEEKRKQLVQLQAKADPCSTSKDPEIAEKRKQLFAAFDANKKNGRLRLRFLFRYFFSWPVFRMSDEFSYHKRKKVWTDRQGTIIMHQVSMRKIGKAIGLRWNPLKNELTLPDGRNIWTNACNHLPKQIQKTFRIAITNPQWQHWNGGVFLFNADSYPVMDTWHAYTLQIFNDPAWKTRDQGTLIATAWKYGLQDHPTLDTRWNLILDYYNQELDIEENGEITIDGKLYKKPVFVHIYHHWGDTEWKVWNRVMQLMDSTG